MVGEFINKYCKNCDKTVEVHVSTGFVLDDKEYYLDCICPICENDLSKNEKIILKEARAKGIEVPIFMS